jgi:hypothetical protein
LTRKRTRLSKSFFNKSLLLKLVTKINNHNNNTNLLALPLGAKTDLKTKNAMLPTDLIGKGQLLSPINKNKLDKILGWSPNNIDLSEEYKTLSTALLILLKNKAMDSPQNNARKLANKIFNNLTSLSKQFTNELNNKLSFINNYNTKLGTNFKPAGLANPNNKNITKITQISDSKNLSFNGFNILALQNAAKVVKLINNNRGNIFFVGAQSPQKDYNFNLIKEALKAYNYSIFNNKNSVDSSGLLGNPNNLKKFKLLGNLLAKIFKKNVEIQLIKLHNVGLDSKILAQAIGLNAKFDKTAILLKKLLRRVSISKASLIHFNKQNSILNGNANVYDVNLYNNSIIPVFSDFNNKTQDRFAPVTKPINLIANYKNNVKIAQLHDKIDAVQVLNSNPLSLGKTVGLSIRIAGRLRADPIKPKQTVKSIIVGNFSKERVNTSNISSFTSKNKKGTFRITVKLGQSRTMSTKALH